MNGDLKLDSFSCRAVQGVHFVQILTMFLIAAGNGVGTIAAVWIGARRLFDERQRLRLDRLRAK